MKGSLISGGDIAWVLMSCALVLFITPGLALFYGGMVRGKNVLNMLMMNFFTISIVTVVWVLGGWTLAFGGEGAVGGVDGAMFGNAFQLWYQFVGVAAVLTFSFVATWVIAKVVDATVGLGADDGTQAEGLDISIHEERAYVLADSR